MTRTIWLAGAAALALALPAALQGQEVEGASWTVNFRAGAQLYPEASAIKTGAGIGVEALYRITPRVAVGPSLDYVAARTDGRFFIAVLDFGPDSSRIMEVGQDIHATHAGLNVLVDFAPEGRIAPYVAGGAGGYTLYLSPRSNDGAKRSGGLMFQAGGGVGFRLSDAAGLQLDVRDIIYTDFDRDALNPIRLQHRNRRPDGTFRFPGAEYPELPGPESTAHNIRLSLAFSYIPGLNR